MAVSSMFTTNDVDHGDHVHRYWVLDAGRLEELAEFLAVKIAERNTRGAAPGLFDAWNARRHGSRDHPQPLEEGLQHLLGLAVGTPSQPKPSNHVQALVAEHLWHQIELENSDLLGSDEYVQGPSLRVEDHGGDGLAIIRSDSDRLLFRLWEVKKRNPAGSLRPTVQSACAQLTENGYGYLAQVSETIQAQAHPDEIREFAARMTERWVGKDVEANVGVAIKAQAGSRRPDSFSRMPEMLPDMDGTARRVGIAIESDDFATLADRVQEILWSGL